MKRFTLVLLIGAMSAAVALGQATRPAEPAAKPSAEPSAAAASKAKAGDDAKPEPKLVLKGHRAASAPVTGSEDGKWTSYDAMHNFFVERFVESEGFGIARTIRQRDLARSNALYVSGNNYRVGPVRLLSLGQPDKDGKLGKPFAYEPTEGIKFLGNDPLRNVLKHNEHKALTAVEAEALAKLQAGEQTVMAGEGETRMLIGAVRATTQCLECHSVKEGTLLGAFKYPLVRVEPPKPAGSTVVQ